MSHVRDYSSQTAEIDPTALVGPNVVIGPGAKIGPGARLQRCVVMANATVRDHAWVQSSIIGWNSTVGRWARVENITVLGDDVTIKDELYVNGASVLPHKSVSALVSCDWAMRLIAPISTRNVDFKQHYRASNRHV